MSWRSAFERVEPADCVCLVSSSAPCKIVLPLTILCLKTIVKRLPSREAVSSHSELANMCGFRTETTSGFSSVTSTGNLRVKLKAKKQHEIDRLVDFVKLLKESSLGGSFHHVIDIGAGMGHLSRILSMTLPGCSVVAVEKNDELIKKSVHLNERLRRCCSAFIKPKHHCESVQAASQGLGITQLNRDQMGLLIGLHPCGDLSSTILRLFVESQNVAGMILFGCCYHKLTVINEKQHTFTEEMLQTCGFPLSSRYRTLSFSRSALDLACHGNESFVEQLLTKPHSSYRANCYRAVLEYLIANHTDEEVRRQRGSFVMNSVYGSKDLMFEEYTRIALAKYPDVIQAIYKQIANDQAARALINAVDGEWRHLLVVHCLRLLFAPIIEHIIIQDRVQFLEEYGHSAFLIPLFDPRISPRNFAIVAFKGF